MKRGLSALVITLVAIFGLFYVTNELLTTKFEWWTIPMLIIVWLLVIMGGFFVFDMMTSTDESRGEEDKRKGRWHDD